MRRYGLPCHRLAIGDCCISLTRRQDSSSGIGCKQALPASMSTPPQSSGASGDVTTIRQADIASHLPVAVGIAFDGNGLRGQVSRDSRFPNIAAETVAPVDYSMLRSPAPGTHAPADPMRIPPHLSAAAARPDRLPPPLPAVRHPVLASVPVGRSTFARKRRHSDSDAARSSISAADREGLDSGGSATGDDRDEQNQLRL
jgi:hypothetical protein